MVLYEVTKVKAAVGETGTTNDEKIKRYGEMADNTVIGDTINVRNMTNPPTVVVDVLTQNELNQIKNFATQIAIGYFYKFESGDTLTVEQAEASWKNWYIHKFQRPTWTVRGGETAR